MRRLFRALRKARFSYKPLVEVFVYREHLLHNLSVFEHLNKDIAVAPVLKSNAYGHGIVEVGCIYDLKPSIPFFVVDTYYEALVLRNESIRKPILILGNTFIENIQKSKLENVSFGITSLEQLKECRDNLTETVMVHVKVDTGMHRQGLLPGELDEAIAILKNNEHFVVEGLCSHFPDADGEDDVFTKKQITVWNDTVKMWRKHFPETKYFHIANTAGEYFKNIDANVARVGIGLYGIGVQPRQDLDLKPALTMKTTVSQVKRLKKDDTVGYGRTFTASSDMTVATIPVGYNEGVPRRLSNKGFVEIRGVVCPIVGRVSMNMTTVNVSHIPDVVRGDEVVVISADSHAENSAAHMAALAGTIPYVILVHIPESLRRVVV